MRPNQPKLIKGRPVRTVTEPELETVVEEVGQKVDQEVEGEPKVIKRLTVDLIDVLKNYVDKLAQFILSTPEVYDAARFDPDLVKPYVGYFCFDSRLAVDVCILNRKTYLEILEQTSPDLWKLVSGTDLRDRLPQDKDGINIYDSNPFPNIPYALGLLDEPGRTMMKKLRKSSESVRFLPDLAFLSLFMGSGGEFREYLAAVPYQEIFPLFVRYKKIPQFTGIPPVEVNQNVPAASDLFASSRLTKYIEQSGSSRIGQMMTEYEWLEQYLNSGNASEGRMKPLYERLEKANQGLAKRDAKQSTQSKT